MNTIRRSVLVVSCALALGTTTPAHADIFEDILGGVDKVSKWVTDIGNSIDNWFTRVFRELGDIADDAEATANAIANMVEEQAASAEPFVNNAAAFAELRFQEVEQAVTAVIIGMDEFNNGQTVEKCVGPCADFREQMVELLGARRVIQDMTLDFVDVTPIDFPSLDFDLELIESAPAFVLYPLYVTMQASLGGNVNGALNATLTSLDDLEDLVAIAQGQLPSGAVSSQKVSIATPERSLAYTTNTAPADEEPLCSRLLADGVPDFADLTWGQERIYSGQSASFLFRLIGGGLIIAGETRVEGIYGNRTIKNNKMKKVGISFSVAGDVVAEVANAVNHRFQTCKVIRETLVVNDNLNQVIGTLLDRLGHAQGDIERLNRLNIRNTDLLNLALKSLDEMQQQQDRSSAQTEEILRILAKQQYTSTGTSGGLPASSEGKP